MLSCGKHQGKMWVQSSQETLGTYCAKYVVIVGYCGNKLEDEAAASARLVTAITVLHMLPSSPCVLLVHAHCVFNNHGLACKKNDYMTEAWPVQSEWYLNFL